MPKRLLRSIIEFDKEISPENLVLNFQHLRRAVDTLKLNWGRPEDEKIYKHALGFFIQYFEMPPAQTVLDYFESVRNVEVIERIKDIQVEKPSARAGFVQNLRNLQEAQAQNKAVILLKETHEILIRGIEDKKGEPKKGLEDAIQHFTKKSQEIRIEDTYVKIDGDIRAEDKEMLEEYDIAKSDKGKVIGALCGINEIDDVCKGAKKGELWIHAAYPGELKTWFSSNWAYNAMTRFKKHVVFVSLENKREQIRRSIFTIHTSNARFAQQGFKPLDYEAIRDGLLTSEEEAFYKERVIPDFKSNPTYTQLHVVAPDREWNMDDIQSKIELLHKEFEVGIVFIDHGQEVAAREKYKDYVIELNSVIKDAKRLSLRFDHNKGVPVVLNFQINRQGKDDANKNDGVYQLKALTYANYAEKAADVITTTYLNDELRKAKLTKFSNLKNRDNPLFAPFQAHVNFANHRILSQKRMEPKGFVVEEYDSYLQSMQVQL